MARRNEGSRKGEGLNLVPFIDIMLVLLAIVLSISTFIAQGQIPIQVPQASASEHPKDEKTMQIAIDSQNRIFFQDKEISLKGLKEELARVSPQTLIELRSDKESKFDSFIQVINLLKDKQHEHFAISARKD